MARSGEIFSVPPLRSTSGSLPLRASVAMLCIRSSSRSRQPLRWVAPSMWVRPSSLVALRINGERAGIYVELLGEIDDQRRRRQLIRFQRARRIAQADQYQCEAKLVGFPTALRDKRQIFGSECRMAENLSLVRGKTKQPRPCRLAQQPLPRHHATSLCRRVARLARSTDQAL